ncbi:MAG: hypothetical protein QOF84_5810 [Streptomyces sp.]|jgi:hypothetical protein|nr:hypothetical protein [Streptomyces sp.]
MARARTCYDHLAGRLGIAITDAMTGRALLEQRTGFALTDAGLRWYAGLGIDLIAATSTRRPLARPCLDWTERRPHLAGVAGAALCGHALGSGWCVRIGTQRALRLTAEGRRALYDHLGIEADDLEIRTE